MVVLAVDYAGRGRSPATIPGRHAGRAPRNGGRGGNAPVTTAGGRDSRLRSSDDTVALQAAARPTDGIGKRLTAWLTA